VSEKLHTSRLIVKDRMLVRVGHHDEEKIPLFDEASLVRCNFNTDVAESSSAEA